MFTRYAKAEKPLSGNLDRTEHGSRCVVGSEPADYTPYAGFEIIELHANSGPGSGFVGIVSNRLGIASEPVHYIHFDPGNGPLLVIGVLDLEFLEVVQDVCSTTISLLNLA